jgi:hypothetical protein
VKNSSKIPFFKLKNIVFVKQVTQKNNAILWSKAYGRISEMEIVVFNINF